MKDLLKLEDIVREILTNDEKTRENDDLLFMKVCEQLNGNVLNHSFGAVLQDFNRYGLPKYASVGRARRKLQAACPELRPKKEVEKFRSERAVDFMNYARTEVR